MSGLQEFLISLPAYLVAISLLVAVHEYGHFFAARRLGIQVLRFSIGFGRVLWRRVGKDGVEYVLSVVPIGGYVRCVDERDGAVAPRDLPRAFNRQPVWKRITVFAAGPAFNFFFAVILYWILLMAGVAGLKPVVGDVAPNSIAAQAGLRTDDEIIAVGARATATREAVVNELIQALLDSGRIELKLRGRDGVARGVVLSAEGRTRELTERNALFTGLGFEFWRPHFAAVIAKTSPDGAAQRAGLRPGDEIVAFDEQPIADFPHLYKVIQAHPNRKVVVAVLRQGENLRLPMQVGEQTQNGRSVGVIGIEAAAPAFPAEMRIIERSGPAAALAGAVAKTWDLSRMTVKFIGRLLTGEVSVNSISGPVGIAVMAGEIVQYGVTASLTFLALISVSLGVLNLLPLPILDGGQIVYQLVELLKGGPVSERAQVLFQQLGIVLLVLLMGLALYNDIAHLS